VSSLKPQVIIHAASERRVDAAVKNPERTKALNVDATEHLAKLAKQCKAWFLYISTDYVFDGQKPPYKVDSSPNPINLYGKTKVAAENAVRRVLSDNYCILRVPLLYGTVESLEESGVTALAELVRIAKPVKIDNWAVRYPTYTEDVAYACAQLCQLGLSSQFGGIYHFSGDEALTKFQQAVLICNLWGIKADFIVADDNPPPTSATSNTDTQRPHNCRLDVKATESLGISKVTKISTALAKVLQPFKPQQAQSSQSQQPQAPSQQAQSSQQPQQPQAPSQPRKS